VNEEPKEYFIYIKISLCLFSKFSGIEEFLAHSIYFEMCSDEVSANNTKAKFYEIAYLDLRKNG
jgi:hypothetical protein